MKITNKKMKFENKISKRTGNPFVNQILTIELNDEVRNLKVYRDSESDLLPLGEYQVAAESFRINEYGSLEIGFLNLVQKAA